MGKTLDNYCSNVNLAIENLALPLAQQTHRQTSLKK